MLDVDHRRDTQQPRPKSHRALLVLTGLLAVIAMRPPIQALQDTSSAPAQFRSGVDLVRIDIAALDGKRQPVLGLTAGDFVLRLDGTGRAHSRVRGRRGAPPPAVPMVRAPWTREVAPDVQTNTGPEDGRLVVIFFDRTIPPGPVLVTAKKIAASVVSELGPHDLAALTSTRGSAAQNFTADKALLLDAISRTIAGAAPGELEASASAMVLPASANAIFAAHEACYCNACVLEQLQAVADSLRNVSRRKVLIFIGSALTMDARDSGAPGGECEWPLKNARTKLLAALDRSHLVVNSFDPSGLATGGVGQAGSPLRAGQMAARGAANPSAALQGQLRVLPDRTGGRTVVNTNMPQGLVPNVLSESAAYYVIGFDAPSKPVNIDLRSNRRGVTVRTQRVYDPAPPASMVAPDPESTSGESETEPVARALSGTLPARGISLSASVLPMTLPGSDTSGVLVITDLAAGTGPRSSVSEALPPRLEMIVSAFDQRARPQREDRFSLEIPAASSRRVHSALRGRHATATRPGPL